MSYSDDEISQAQTICDSVSDAVDRMAALQKAGRTPEDDPQVWRDLKRALEGVRVKAETNPVLNHVFEDGVAETVDAFVEQADDIDTVEAHLQDQENKSE